MVVAAVLEYVYKKKFKKKIIYIYKIKKEEKTEIEKEEPEKGRGNVSQRGVSGKRNWRQQHN